MKSQYLRIVRNILTCFCFITAGAHYYPKNVPLPHSWLKYSTPLFELSSQVPSSSGVHYYPPLEIKGRVSDLAQLRSSCLLRIWMLSCFVFTIWTLHHWVHKCQKHIKLAVLFMWGILTFDIHATLKTSLHSTGGTVPPRVQIHVALATLSTLKFRLLFDVTQKEALTSFAGEDVVVDTIGFVSTDETYPILPFTDLSGFATALIQSEVFTLRRWSLLWMRQILAGP